MPPRRRIWLLLPALAIVTLAAYQPAWYGGVLWDDDSHMTAPALRTAAGLWRIWFDLGATQQYYPLAHSVFWLQHALWGGQTLGYHLVNLALHAGSAFLIVLILRRLAVPGAVLAGVVFALHPVHVESVAWITELKNTLSGVFYLAAAFVYLTFDEQRGRRVYAAAAVLFALALLSKTVTATLPASLLVVFWWTRGRVTWRRDARPLVPFFVLGIAAGLFTAWVERTYIGAAGAEFDLTLLERCLLAARALWFYAGTLVWPTGLTFIYPKWQISQSDPALYLYVAAAVAVLASLWAMRRRARAPLAAALLFGGTLFPALGFFNVYPFRFSYVADHFVYLASVAPIALFSAGVCLGLARLRVTGRGPQLAAAAAIGIPLAVLTWHQSRQYVNAETLYRSTLARNPSCWMCHNNLAALKLEEGDARLREALAHVDESLRIQPRQHEAHNNRGVVLRRLGRLDEAIGAFEEAVRQSPAFADAHMNLGVALHGAGRLEEALPRFEQVIRSRPDASEAHEQAGAVLIALGRPDAAIPHLEAVLRLQPGVPGAHDRLGTALAWVGRVDDALGHFEAARRGNPGDADVRNNLASALARLGRVEEAVREYQESLRLNPGSARVHDNLGYLLLQRGQRAEAVPHFEQALRLQPDYAPAHVNAGNLLLGGGRPAEAIVHYQQALARPEEIDAAQVHSNLGVALAMTGRRVLAIRHFEEALRLRPDFAEARANLARARGR